MSIENYYNAEYPDRLLEWQQLEDCFNEKIKVNGDTYLPKTSGMERDTKYGQKRYEAYKRRANYFNYTYQTVINSKNAIARKPAVVSELPSNMEYLTDKFNSDNESILSVLDNVYKEQMKVGRVGYLVDYISDIDQFETVEYKAAAILDWRFERREGLKKLVYVLLNEDIESINSDGITVLETKYRILGLDSDNEFFTIVLDSDDISSIGIFKKYTEKDLSIKEESVYEIINDQKYYTTQSGHIFIYPNVTGKVLNYIPFRVANANDEKMTTSQPPLLNQSNLSIGVYNASANHEDLIYKQSASMLTMTGVDKSEQDKYTQFDGVKMISDPNAKVYYVGVDGEGLTESRLALNDLKQETASFGTTVMEKNTQEAGKTLQSRIQLQTEKLKEVSKTGASLVQALLRIMSEWVGNSEDITDEITVTANEDFRTEKEKADEFEKIFNIWSQNGISDESYYNWQLVNGYTVLKYEDWLKQIKEKNSSNVVNDNNTNTDDGKTKQGG